MPGDRLHSGATLKSERCAGRQDPVLYTSPTVKYAGLQCYAKAKRIGQTSTVAQILFQCRQKPDTFKVQRETMKFSLTNNDPYPYVLLSFLKFILGLPWCMILIGHG